MQALLRYISPSRHFISFFILIVLSTFNIPRLLAEEFSKKNSKQDSISAIKSDNDQDEYILGPGDVIFFEVIGLPEFTGNLSIGPDGFLYLPEIRDVKADGLTVSELRESLTKSFKSIMYDPKIYIRVVSYRPIRIYIAGEVQRPGLYTLNGFSKSSLTNNQEISISKISEKDYSSPMSVQPKLIEPTTFSSMLFPTLFDAIRASQGITSYSNLSDVTIVRNNTKTNGGGKIKTNVSLLSLITKGDLSQNIRIFDGDTIVVGKSPSILKEQIIQASATNLSPQAIDVFVTGNVSYPGSVTLPQGSGLLQAIAMSGGKKVFTGKIVFLRFNKKGDLDRRIFNFDGDEDINSYKNPILMSGDIINVDKTVLGKTASVVGEISRPIVGIYSLYNLFD